MPRRQIITCTMLTPEHRLQLLEEIQVRQADRVAAGFPPDSPEPKDEKDQTGKDEEEEAMEPEPEPQEEEEKEAKPDDEAYVEANKRFIRQEQAATEVLFVELDMEAWCEEEEEPPEAQELPHLPVYPASGTEIVDIFNDE
nr:protein TsetseEP-like [Aegilops tauschii subsp. strangulata]